MYNYTHMQTNWWTLSRTQTEEHMYVHKHINSIHEFGLGLSFNPTLLRMYARTLTHSLVFLSFVDTKPIWDSITASLCAGWSLTISVNLRSPVLLRQLLGEMLWEALRTTSKRISSSSSAGGLCLISFTSPAKPLSQTSMLNTEKTRKTTRERDHGAFYLVHGTDQTGKGYKKDLYDSKLLLQTTFSVKKIDGFIILLHYVHVFVQHSVPERYTLW